MIPDTTVMPEASIEPSPSIDPTSSADPSPSVTPEASPTPTVSPIANPWHNAERPGDVTNDGVCTSADALAVVNWINTNGEGNLPLERPATAQRVDIDNDRRATAADFELARAIATSGSCRLP